MVWTQYAVDAVRSGHSRIVVYGGGDIFFDTKRSNQSTQWMQWNSGIWWWGHCLWCKKGQTRGCSGCSMQYTVRSRIVVYGGGDIVFGAKRSNQWIQWIQSHSGHST